MTGSVHVDFAASDSCRCYGAYPGSCAVFAETEAILNVSHATCYRLISAGKLDARKLLGKTVITGESITRLIAELPKVGQQT